MTMLLLFLLLLFVDISEAQRLRKKRFHAGNCYRNGQFYEDGDIIQEDGVTPCKEFKCRDGVIMFITYVCPSLRCPDHFKMRLPWECCPRCLRKG